jgi:transposase
MKSITKWLQSAILRPVPELSNPSLPGKSCGKLRLTPEQLLAAIHAQELADWSLHTTGRLVLLYLPTYNPWLNPIEML